MPQALISLGSNLGERAENLDRAVRELRLTPGMQVIAISSWHATQPVGGPPGQREFLNGAALLETTLAPHELLARLLEIEASLGRVRSERWGPRMIDLDLLLYDDLVLNVPDLVVPHPRMAERGFVLEPAAEIAGTLFHPTMGKTVSELAALLRAKQTS